MQGLPDDCWFLTGPTASGKSAAALAVASSLDAEIVAMDSMTVYRGMDIGTAKPTVQERSIVPHHLIDVLHPSESATLNWYLQQAHRAYQEIRERGKQPLFVGGTPLYLKACLHGVFDGPAADDGLRAELAEEIQQQGVEALHRRLEQVDPVSATRIHPSNSRRIIRALEVFLLTGVPISRHQQEFERPPSPQLKAACINRPRQELYERINRRVGQMIDAGWIEEVEAVFSDPRGISPQAAQAAGYQELQAFREGTMDWESAVERIQTRTRQLAKRQLTWLRKMKPCKSFETNDSESTSQLAARLLDFYQSPAPK